MRLRRSAERLARSDDPIATVAADAGFGDLSTFYAHFRRMFGYSPRAHRRRRD
jgi:AraC-like DNA-binding protein